MYKYAVVHEKTKSMLVLYEKMLNLDILEHIELESISLQ